MRTVAQPTLGRPWKLLPLCSCLSKPLQGEDPETLSTAPGKPATELNAYQLGQEGRGLGFHEEGCVFLVAGIGAAVLTGLIAASRDDVVNTLQVPKDGQSAQAYQERSYPY